MEIWRCSFSCTDVLIHMYIVMRTELGPCLHRHCCRDFLVALGHPPLSPWSVVLSCQRDAPKGGPPPLCSRSLRCQNWSPDWSVQDPGGSGPCPLPTFPAAPPCTPGLRAVSHAGRHDAPTRALERAYPSLCQKPSFPDPSGAPPLFCSGRLLRITPDPGGCPASTATFPPRQPPWLPADSGEGSGHFFFPPDSTVRWLPSLVPRGQLGCPWWRGRRGGPQQLGAQAQSPQSSLGKRVMQGDACGQDCRALVSESNQRGWGGYYHVTCRGPGADASRAFRWDSLGSRPRPTVTFQQNSGKCRSSEETQSASRAPRSMLICSGPPVLSFCSTGSMWVFLCRVSGLPLRAGATVSSRTSLTPSLQPLNIY